MASSRQIHYESKYILRLMNGHEKIELAGREMTLGSSRNCNISIINHNVAPVHCFLTCDDTGWIVKDNGSPQGTYVSGHLLRQDDEHRLEDGDKVLLGQPLGMPPAFIYEKETKILRMQYLLFDKSDAESSDDSYDSDDSSDSRVKKNLSNSNIPVKKILEVPSQSESESEDDEAVVTFINEVQYKIALLETEVRYLRSSKAELVNRRKANDRIHRKKELDFKITFLKDQITALQSSQAATNARKIVNRGKEIKYLKKLNTSLQESKKDISKNFENSLQRIDCLAHMLVKHQVEMIHIERSVALITRLDVKSQIFEKLEEDLICIICTELLIKPVLLECCHMFCQHCILEWRSRKNECPICKRVIESIAHLRGLEQFLDKTVAILNPEQQVRRTALIAERDQIEMPPVLRREESVNRRGYPRRRQARTINRANQPTTAPRQPRQGVAVARRARPRLP